MGTLKRCPRFCWINKNIYLSNFSQWAVVLSPHLQVAAYTAVLSGRESGLLENERRVPEKEEEEKGLRIEGRRKETGSGQSRESWSPSCRHM